jgi:hypothetical protein
MDRWVGPDDVIVEFGSGRSTAWLAERAGRIVSIEHHREWHAKVTGQLAGRANAEVRLVEDQPEAYVGGAADVSGITIVINDGRYRDICAKWALQVLGPGGAMLLDDSQRYLDPAGRFTRPSVPKTPQGSALWDLLMPELRSWRRLTYCDGVKDTTLLLRRAGG